MNCQGSTYPWPASMASTSRQNLGPCSPWRIPSSPSTARPRVSWLTTQRRPALNSRWCSPWAWLTPWRLLNMNLWPRKDNLIIYLMRSFSEKENSIGSVVNEILTYKQKRNLITLYHISFGYKLSWILRQVCKISRNYMYSPQFKTLSEWFSYAFKNSDLDEVDRFPVISNADLKSGLRDKGLCHKYFDYIFKNHQYNSYLSHPIIFPRILKWIIIILKLVLLGLSGRIHGLTNWYSFYDF